MKTMIEVGLWVIVVVAAIMIGYFLIPVGKYIFGI